jgi:hypothetical protein
VATGRKWERPKNGSDTEFVDAMARRERPPPAAADILTTPAAGDLERVV